MDDTGSRRQAAELMLRTSVEWMHRYEERHRKLVIACKDLHGMEEERIAEITGLPIEDVRRILRAAG
jgi:hypothetical protein